MRVAPHAQFNLVAASTEQTQGLEMLWPPRDEEEEQAEQPQATPGTTAPTILTHRHPTPRCWQDEAHIRKQVSGRLWVSAQVGTGPWVSLLANLYPEVTMAWLRQNKVPGCEFRREDSFCLYPRPTAAFQKTPGLGAPFHRSLSLLAQSWNKYLLFMIRTCGSSSCFKPGCRPQAGPPPSLSPSLAEKLGFRSFFRERAGGRATVLLSASRPRFWAGGGER